MDYEKKYKEALVNARQEYNTTENVERKRWLEELFPELKETEDERIRKELLEHCINRIDGKQVCVEASDYRRWADWLFRQGVENISNVKSDREISNEIIKFLELPHPQFVGKRHQEEWIAWLEKQGKSEYSLKSYNHEDVHKFMEYIEKEAKNYDLNLPNRSYDIYGFAKDILCWLEKQGEKESDPRYKYLEDLLIADDIYQMAMDNTMVEVTKSKAVNALCKLEIGKLLGIEKQGEQKDSIIDFKAKDWYVSKVDGHIHNMHYSVDKVEPKFKVGDWVVDDECGKLNQIDSVRDKGYDFANGDYMLYESAHKELRLWTIQDAKDGDVLVNGSNIFIFHFINDTRLMGYCHVNIDNGRFYDDIGQNECFCLIDAVVTPATKEQRDTLFKAMADAGYEFDFEKNELKKIE